jgi:hypothetical protein
MKLYLKEQAYYLQQALESNALKLMAILAALFAPIQGIMITVGLAILADTAVGIWKALKLKERISSRKLGQVISKMLIYQATIVLFFLIDKFILGDITSKFFAVEYLLTKAIALTLASVEVFSIDENIKQVRGSGLMEAFKRLIKKSKEIRDDLDDFDANKF